jgi:hypothetical protein
MNWVLKGLLPKSLFLQTNKLASVKKAIAIYDI